MKGAAGKRVELSIQEQLHSKNVERFRGGLVCKARTRVYHSTLGSRVIKNKKKVKGQGLRVEGLPTP